MTILGIIPARGGSKGIPRKNIKLLYGRPLLAWSIEAARNSRLLDRFVVSTEDAEIATVAREWGAEVLDRPPELAADTAISREVIKHALVTLDADVSVLLQPTNPIRDDDLIDRVVQAFLDGDYDSMATGWMNPVYPPHGEEHRRQDISDVFVNDGNIVVSTRETILAGSLFGQKRGTMVLDREQNVDIDESFDFWMAEKLMEKRTGARPEMLRETRDQAARNRHLMAVHFLKAAIEEVGEETAHRIADLAFSRYAREMWGGLFKDLDETGRENKFRLIMKDAAAKDPDLRISSDNGGQIETLAMQCAAEKVYRTHGLSDYFRHFCDQDFTIAKMISPTANLDRPETLPTGNRQCRHTWRFNGRPKTGE